MRTDPAAVASLAAEIEQHKAHALPHLRAKGFIRADGTRDDKAVREHAEKSGVSKRTAGGKVSTSVDALQEIDDPDLKLLVDYLGWLKLESTYLPVVDRGTREPIQARYGIVESGRTSCSNPNLQNLPRKGGVRQCFVPRPGWVYVAADYSIVELVCLSQVLLKMFGNGNSRMADALIEGQDLHLVTAAMLLRRSYDDTLQAYKDGEPAAKQARQLAKALSFGIPGGLGPAKLAAYLGNYGIKVTESEAKNLKNDWLRLFPEMRLYFDRISAEARFGGTSKHPITGFLRGGLEYCSLANHYFQHLASYGAKVALYAVQRACWAQPDSPLYGSRLVAFIHDELLLEVPENRVHDAAQELSALMISEFLVACPDVPVKVESLAMRRWTKDAKPKYQNGVLVPWEG
jgi:DNA polymerase-1